MSSDDRSALPRVGHCRLVVGVVPDAPIPSEETLHPPSNNDGPKTWTKVLLRIPG